MSVNIKIKLPAATILAIQEAAKRGDNEAIRTVRPLTDRAVLDAVQQLPYHLIPKNNILEKSSKPQSRKHSLDTNSTIEPSGVKRLRKTPNSFQIFVKTNSGRTITIDVDDDSTIDEVKSETSHRGGIPPNHPRLLFSGRQMRDGKTITEENIPPNSMLHLVLRLVGS